ncbi:MAG: hypothetical protein JSS02_10855 [Planctomycetes bacterium]|nr:hypothetical protein [Planctomycetota bacterium]
MCALLFKTRWTALVCSWIGWTVLLAGISLAAPPAAETDAPDGFDQDQAETANVFSDDMERVRQRIAELEQQNQSLHTRLQRLEVKRSDTPQAASDPEDSQRLNSARSAREAGGVEAQGTEGRTFVRELDSKPPRRPAKVTFAEGLEFGSEDGQFKLTFHNLTQAEYRGFPPDDLGNLQDQFFIPRQRWYFTGQATPAVEFYTVINRGYGSLDVLDAFITLNPLEALTDHSSSAGENEYGNPLGAQGTGGRTINRGKGNDSRLRFRVGRMKTPYLYEYFSISEGDLISPERSLYAGNLAGNRQDGAMFLGELFEERFSYAIGVFNGPRRSFHDYNSDKDIYLYLNMRPFLKVEELECLNYLNIGACINGGNERNPTQPSIFTTASDQSSAANDAVVQSLSPTFLAFNSNVTELGRREQWSGSLVWFYKSLTLLSEYGGGYQGYSLNQKTSQPVHFDGFTVHAAYFLTGEQTTRRVNLVRPIHRFGYDNGQFGLGAWEIQARYSNLHLGREVFNAGFADPLLWANQAEAVDLGVNWYWNFYTKIMFDWQHATYNKPITSGTPGHYLTTTDLFWLRFQLFF